MWVIRACGELLRRGLNFRLIIAGDGRKKEQLQHLAEQQAPGRVSFIGKIPRADMYRCYSAADLFVFPGIRESLGMVYLEAQSCGLPVVAFRNAGVPEAVQDGKTAILVPLFAMEPFADAIGQLITDKNMRKQMGLAAKSYVREFHDLSKNYQELENALGSIVLHRI